MASFFQLHTATRCVPVIVTICLLVACAGCPSRPAPPAPDEPNGSLISPEPEGITTTQEPPTVVEPAPEGEIPAVEMTDALAATCLVKVGDTMPEAELPALDGTVTPLRDEYGRKLTVILFWTATSIYATAELEDLTEDVAMPFADKGVRVIGINEGDTAEEAAKQVEQLGVKFSNFLDPNRDFFAKVATEKIPRTYLLDAGGKILWFDIEYSTTTRRDLLKAIRVALGAP